MNTYKVIIATIITLIILQYIIERLSDNLRRRYFGKKYNNHDRLVSFETFYETYRSSEENLAAELTVALILFISISSLINIYAPAEARTLALEIKLVATYPIITRIAKLLFVHQINMHFRRYINASESTKEALIKKFYYIKTPKKQN